MKISKGSVFKKKGSPYLYINISINKKRYLINTYFEHDKIEHVETVELPLLKAKLLNGEINLDKEDESLNNRTFEYYSNIFLDTKKYLKDGTYTNLINTVRRFNNQFGSIHIKDIKTSNVKQYLFSLNIKPLVFRNYLSVLKGIFNEALIDNYVSINVAENIKIPKSTKDNNTVEPFTIQEVNLLLDSSNGWFRNYLAFAFYTGCRTGEIFALKWDNIDFKKKKILIDSSRGKYIEGTTKSGKSRYVPLFDSLIPYLKSQKIKTGMSKYVFLTRKGYNLSHDYLTVKNWYPLLETLGLKKRRIYNTRHTFATNMLTSSNFDINKISYWLGHSNIRTVITHYNRYIESELNNYDSKFDLFCHKNCNNSSKVV